MKNHRKLRFVACVAALWVLPWLSGCGLSLGPQVKREVVFVHTTDEAGQPVAVGQVARNVRLPVVTVCSDGKVYETKVDVGGWQLSVPPALQK